MSAKVDLDHPLVVDLRGVDRPLHRVAAALEPGLLGGSLHDTDAEVVEAGSIEAELTVQDDGTVLLRAAVHAGFNVPCARCLGPSRVPVAKELVRTYLPVAEYRRRIAGASGDDEDGVELAEEELDVEAYEPPHIDLRRALGEHVAVAYPMRVLCAQGEGCLGLCSGCGSNLNDVPDGEKACVKCGRSLEGDIGAFSAPEESSPWKRALKKLNSGEDDT